MHQAFHAPTLSCTKPWLQIVGYRNKQQRRTPVKTTGCYPASLVTAKANALCSPSDNSTWPAGFSLIDEAPQRPRLKTPHMLAVPAI
eukprot:1156571-Pelagomonas_calceolata.AAC.5